MRQLDQKCYKTHIHSGTSPDTNDTLCNTKTRYYYEILLYSFTSMSLHILRFRHNLQNKKDSRIGYLSIAKLNSALYTILNLIQNQCFLKEFNQLSKTDRVDSRSQLKVFNPFIDDKGKKILA
jgi:hypothetical protein